MSPLVFGSSEYGSRRAAPQDPRAPVQMSELECAGFEGRQTVSVELPTAEVQSAILAVVYQLRKLVAPVFTRRGASHKVESIL